MTAAEWDRTTEFRKALWDVSGPPMLPGVHGRVRSWLTSHPPLTQVPSHRKVLLALAGLGRRVWAFTGHGSTDGHGEWADRCERYADDQGTVADIVAVSRTDGDELALPTEYVFYLSALRCPGPAGVMLRELAVDLWGRLPLLSALVTDYFPERSASGCGVLREVFGNPYRRAACSPAWRTDTVLSLAAHIYESRDFSAMPILGDALQDAGCGNNDVLNHCRGPGPHVRGCWVVDLLLGKE